MADIATSPDTSSFLALGVNLDSFPCEICSKTFSKRLSRNRHRLYCRKKSLTGQPHRKRPCLTCRQAKTKCNSAFPCCRRCGEKKLACVYETKSAQVPQDLIPPHQTILSSDFSFEREINVWDDQVYEVEQAQQSRVSPRAIGAISNQVGSPGMPLDWHINISNEGVLSSELPEIYNAAGGQYTPLSENTALTDFYLDSAETCMTLGWSSDSYEASFGKEMMLDTYPCNTDLSMSSAFTLDISSLDSPRTFFDSPYLKLRYIISLHHSVSSSSSVTRRVSPFTLASRHDGSQVGQSFILQNIRSYPAMLLDAYHPPPFIHRCTLLGNETEEKVATSPAEIRESLAICRNIVQLHAMKTKQTSSFLWRTVDQERKGLDEENANERNILGMLQSLTIYILLRISSESPEDSPSISFDNDIIHTMTSIAVKSEESGFLCTCESLGVVPTWEDWILMESKRRTVMLLFIIHLLFDINPGQRAKALTGLSQLPLPAYKSIWSAANKDEWKTHYSAWLREREGRTALSYGDLINLGGEQRENGGLSRKDLEVWFVNIDPFGMLVCMAATSLSL